MSLSSPYQDPALCRALLDRLQTALDGRELRFMEVCGTHTVSIFQSGLRSLLPKEVTHLSGPGCPVCVTHDAEVAAFLDLAGRDGVIIATFGDLLRVPGPGGRSLKHAQAQGARIEIVYSPLDALNIAAANPGDTVVFLGIGFETTAPTVAATLMMAEQRKLDNFCVLSLHKLVPPVLRALLDDKDGCGVQAFLLPGHVSTILGLEPYGFLASEYRVPAVVGGFEPVDILQALCIMAEQRRDDAPAVVNAYQRAVSDQGNPRARALREIYLRGFEICIKEAHPKNLMTSYNKINGVWSHYNYQLCTALLREEWGYTGNVMTDWWMRYAASPEFPELRDNGYRVRAQVDVLMPGAKTAISKSAPNDGSLLATLGKPDGITLGELQRTAKNVLRMTLRTKFAGQYKG